MDIGLLAHPLIARFIETEPTVKERIGQAARGEAHPTVRVGVVPVHQTRMKTIELHCDHVNVLNGLMQERAVHVTASADHMELLQACQRRAKWAQG